ncbi:MAG: TIGR03960 family B12-binding radical SAM protein [Ruminococcaceae bacterium]|nr:TIGR03960 family B12-binding radical SAM protein [Oscillospiraceae bacterium]
MTRELEKILMSVNKPTRYTGGEYGQTVKDKNKIDTRFAFCFPDTYEIGMSHLGMKILYGALNEHEKIWCERVFAPDVDMEAKMREKNIPLFALESHDPIADFDFIGFTLMYEMCYTNMLNMLDLAGIPVFAKDRKGMKQIVVAGGPCAYNPEPVADFVDIFSIGEGETMLVEICELFRKMRDEGASREEFLRECAKIDGVYVPSLYDVKYNEDGTVSSFEPKCEQAKRKIQKRIMTDFESAYTPDTMIVPFNQTVFDRVTLEVMRGCIRGCRFCQAGMVYRPSRGRSPEMLNSLAKKLCDNTGYEEISLSSLSTSDYKGVTELCDLLLDWTEKRNISLSLPSLRADNFSQDLLERVQKVRKTSLTFAPEAGSQRLRDAINKNVTEEDILSTARRAFASGYTSIKLYFMIGLPTETMEDVEAIPALAQKIVNEFYNSPNRPKGKTVNVSISVSSFVPKPFTPFQWAAQNTQAQLAEKQKRIAECIRTKKISYSYHASDLSVLEAVFARGDRRLGAVLYDAWKNGCTFDSWDEHFKSAVWRKAFENNGLTTEFYANRERSYEEILPWSFIDIGVTEQFMKRENELAKESKTTPNCYEKCSGCGAAKLMGGKCSVTQCE